MDPVDIDRSLLRRRISQRELDENNLTSLPDIPLSSDDEGGDEDSEERSLVHDNSVVSDAPWESARSHQVPSTPLARTIHAPYKNHSLATPRPNRSLANTSHASSSSSSASSMQHFPPPLSESFSLAGNSLGEEASGYTDENSKASPGPDVGPITSTPNSYGLSQRNQYTNSSRTVLGRKSMRADSSVSTGNSGSTLKNPLTYRLQNGRRRRETLGPDETDDVDGSGHSSIDVTHELDASASQNITAIHAGTRMEQSSIGELDIPNLSQDTHSRMAQELADDVERQEWTQPEQTFSPSARSVGSEYVDAQSAENSTTHDEDHHIGREDALDFEVPLNQGSQDSIDAGVGDGSNDLGSPAPNWVDDRRRRYRSKTPKTPSPPTPSVATRPQPSPGSPSSQSNGSGVGLAWNPQEEERPVHDDAAHLTGIPRIPSLSRSSDPGSASDESSVASTPESAQRAPVDALLLSRTPTFTPSVYATPSSIKPSLDDVEEGDEKSALEESISYGGESSMAKALVAHAGKTPARQSHDLSRARDISRSEFSTPGMARGVSTPSRQFQTPPSQMSRTDYSHDLTATPPAQSPVSFSLRDITSTTQNLPLPYSLNMETPKPKANTDKESPALLLQSHRKSFVQSILNSTSKPRDRPMVGRRSARLSTGSSRTEAEISIVGQLSRPSLGGGQSFQEADNTADLSYVSVASSSDLTSDRRGTSSRFKGNISVPGVMPSDVGGGETHADAVKIAKHLSGVNSVLESENRELKAIVDDLQSRIETSGTHHELSQVRGEIRSPSFRSTGQTSIGDMSGLTARSTSVLDETINMPPEVKEMILILTERVQGLEMLVDEKDSAIVELKAKANLLPSEDLDHLRQRNEVTEKLAELRTLEVEQMEEVEQLTARLAANEQEFGRRLAQHAAEFEEIVAEKDGEMESAAKQAASRIERLQMEIEGLAREKDRLRSVLESDNIDEKERRLQTQIQSLEAEIAQERSTNSDLRASVDQLHEELAFVEEELGKGEEAIRLTQQQLEDANGAAEDAAETAERLNVELEIKIRDLHGKDAAIKSAQDDLSTLHEQQQAMIRAHASAISALETEAASLTDEVATSKARLIEIEALLKRAESDHSTQQEQAANALSQLQEEQRSHSQTKSRLSSAERQLAIKDGAETTYPDGRSKAIVIQLEHDLAEATKEIEQLQRARSALSPQVQADLEAKDRRIETLVKEKEELQQRVRGLQVQLDAAQRTPARNNSNATVLAAASPFSSNLPINKRIINLQTPKTPGSLIDHSWLDSSFGTNAEATALARVEALQSELAEAGKRLDENFERLEAAGLRQFTVADRLSQVCGHATELEQQLATATAKHAKALERLSHTKCPGCEHRFDAGDAIRADANQDITMFADQSTPRPRAVNAKNELQSTVSALRRQTDDLRAQWSADCERNRTRVKCLETNITNITKEMHEKTATEAALRSTLQGARREIEDKSAELRQEREALNRLTIANQEFRKSSTDELKLARQDTSVLKQEVRSLQNRLRSVEHSDVHERSTASEHEIRKELKICQESLRAVEAASSELRRTVSQKQGEIIAAEQRWASRTREYDQLKRDLFRLESELKQHRADAAKFGQDLSGHLKKQQSETFNNTAEVQRLREGRQEADRMILSLEGIIADLECNLALQQNKPSDMLDKETAQLLSRQQSQYITERKMLTAQIRYLQAKFTREHMFRGALKVQKQYLLCLLGKFRQTEQDTLAQIASMGYPARRTVERPRYSLKGVALVVLATVRAKRLASDWQQTRSKGMC